MSKDPKEIRELVTQHLGEECSGGEGKVSESPEQVGVNKFKGPAKWAIVGTFHSERCRGRWRELNRGGAGPDLCLRGGSGCWLIIDHRGQGYRQVIPGRGCCNTTDGTWR